MIIVDTGGWRGGDVRPELRVAMLPLNFAISWGEQYDKAPFARKTQFTIA
jgi:hypothetical protein